MRILLITILLLFIGLPSEAKSVKEVYRDSISSIVYVYCQKENSITFGTGFLTEKGLITNAHLINSGLKAKDSSGNELKIGKLIESDEISDLAIYQIESNSKKPQLEFAENKPEIGDEIFIIGNSANYQNTLSTGLISGIRIRNNIEVLQFTAPISVGSSGSPILNSDGKVIGIVTGFLGNQDAQNINFGIPVTSLLSKHQTLKSNNK